MATFPLIADPKAEPAAALDAITRDLVADLHRPRPAVFWCDLAVSAGLGWGAFGLAVAAPPWSVAMWLWALVSGLALYRGLCFTHELTHLRRRSVPGFETAWNLVLGVPILLPSFTYIGVHQSHHSLSTYGTKDDPEYLPFAQSRPMIWLFAVQSSFLLPIALLVRFVALVPIGLAWPRFHRWLEAHASSFSMNPHYVRVIPPAMVTRMKRWELAMVAAWGTLLGAMVAGMVPWRILAFWYGIVTLVSFVNTARVFGAHEYESDGSGGDRHFQLIDSIDTPGGPWTTLWAPVGLRYHALHHYYPGIPYHNLGEAYRRIVATVPADSIYRESTSRSLGRSLTVLYGKARQRGRTILGW